MNIPPDAVPPPIVTPHFVLEPLGPEHNERDHAAWMSSIDHILATPGFAPGDWGADVWPFPMSLEQNLGELVMHRAEFDRAEAFAYSVLDPTDGDVIGCVYIDPDVTGQADVQVRTWVRASHTHLDVELSDLVATWLRDEWPVDTVRRVGRS